MISRPYLTTGLRQKTCPESAREKAVLELLDYMSAKGGVWFARLDQVCDHVQKLMAEGRWTPRYETFPLYQSPLPEFSKER
jgi:hypothetical protein